ncbi:MAG: hypothetical protein AB7P67_11795 [Vicinamibacterales bacterium]
MSCRSSLALAGALIALGGHVALAQPGVPIMGPAPGYRAARGASAHDGALRLQIKPKDAEVFVDGYLMGLVDDFDGTFQRLHLDAGEHTLEVYRAGYRVGRQKIFIGPHATLRVRYTLVKLGPNEAPEPRPAARQVAARGAGPGEPGFPMEGAGPRDPRNDPARRPPIERPRERMPRDRESGYGTLAVHVQPPDAEVLVDGDRWDVDRDGRVELQLAAGRHHVEVRRRGSRPFAQDVDVRPGDVTPLNVSLVTEGGR